MNKPDLATRLGPEEDLGGAATTETAAIEHGPDPEFCVESTSDELGSYDLCESELSGVEATPRPARAAANGVHAPAPVSDLATVADASADLSVDIEPAAARQTELRGWPRFEAWVERLAHKYKFIRKITSRLYLPIAFHSGLTMKKLDPHTFTYVLPFRRFNRNFYDAMAGAALVANSEIAAGMYLFGELGGKWTVVCKNINYRFLRPCLGPAIYKVDPRDELKARLAAGVEFNIDLTLEILQQVSGKRRHPRVGRCDVTFHCTPKGPEGNRGLSRRRKRRKSK